MTDHVDNEQEALERIGNRIGTYTDNQNSAVSTPKGYDGEITTEGDIDQKVFNRLDERYGFENTDVLEASPEQDYSKDEASEESTGANTLEDLERELEDNSSTFY